MQVICRASEHAGGVPAVKQQCIPPEQSLSAAHPQTVLPPMQMSLLHSGLDVQDWPYTSRQAVPALSHTVVVGEAQAPVIPGMHVVAHAEPEQSRPLAQGKGVAGVQLPAPLQVPVSASVYIELLHVALPQLPVG